MVIDERKAMMEARAEERAEDGTPSPTPGEYLADDDMAYYEGSMSMYTWLDSLQGGGTTYEHHFAKYSAAMYWSLVTITSVGCESTPRAPSSSRALGLLSRPRAQTATSARRTRRRCAGARSCCSRARACGRTSSATRAASSRRSTSTRSRTASAWTSSTIWSRTRASRWSCARSCAPSSTSPRRCSRRCASARRAACANARRGEYGGG